MMITSSKRQVRLRLADDVPFGIQKPFGVKPVRIRPVGGVHVEGVQVWKYLDQTKKIRPLTQFLEETTWLGVHWSTQVTPSQVSPRVVLHELRNNSAYLSSPRNVIALDIDVLYGGVGNSEGKKGADPHGLQQAGVHVWQLGTVGQGGQTRTNNCVQLMVYLLGGNQTGIIA